MVRALLTPFLLMGNCLLLIPARKITSSTVCWSVQYKFTNGENSLEHLVLRSRIPDPAESYYVSMYWSPLYTPRGNPAQENWTLSLG